MSDTHTSGHLINNNIRHIDDPKPGSSATKVSSPPQPSPGSDLPPIPLPIKDTPRVQAAEDSELQPKKLARRGTMTANKIKLLLEHIDHEARRGLEQDELEILQRASNRIGFNMTAEQKVTDLVGTLESWKDNLEKKRGRLITFPWGGKTMNVMNLVDDAVGWIRRFREIGDVVVQCDPIHLGLPWAGIKFITQVFLRSDIYFGVFFYFILFYFFFSTASSL